MAQIIKLINMMKRKHLEEKARQHIEKSYNEHSWSMNNNPLIKIICDFYEAQTNGKKNIITVNGNKIGNVFISCGIKFKVTSFPTRSMVCGKNSDASIKLPNTIKVPINSVLFI